jgi:hypothetical protein
MVCWYDTSVWEERPACNFWIEDESRCFIETLVPYCEAAVS